MTFGMDGLGSTVEKTLFSKAKGISFGLACNVAVNLPIIITLALFTGLVVSMSLYVHLLVLWALFKATSVRVKNSLSIGTILGRATKSWMGTLILNLFRPFVCTRNTFTKRFTLD